MFYYYLAKFLFILFWFHPIVFYVIVHKSVNKSKTVVIFLPILALIGWGVLFCSIICYDKAFNILTTPYLNFSDMPMKIQYIAENIPTGAAHGFVVLVGYLYIPVLIVLFAPLYWLTNLLLRIFSKR